MQYRVQILKRHEEGIVEWTFFNLNEAVAGVRKALRDYYGEGYKIQVIQSRTSHDEAESKSEAKVV